MVTIDFDKENKIIKLTDGDTNIGITYDALYPILFEVLNEEQKCRQLAMQIHNIESEQLSKIGFFMSNMIELEKGMQEALKNLEEAENAFQLKKWDLVLSSYTKRKNVLAEVRRSIGLLDRKKKPLRIRIAKLGFDVNEMTGETS